MIRIAIALSCSAILLMFIGAPGAALVAGFSSLSIVLLTALD